MDLSNISQEDLLKELERRENKTDDQNHVVYGTIGNDCGQNYVECFILAKTADDLPNMRSLSLRARFNSHRNMRAFFFKATEDEFNTLSELCDQDNEAFADWVLATQTIQYMSL